MTYACRRNFQGKIQILITQTGLYMPAQLCAIAYTYIALNRFNFYGNTKIGADIEVNQKKGLVINPLFNVLIDNLFTNHPFVLSKK